MAQSGQRVDIKCDDIRFSERPYPRISGGQNKGRKVKENRGNNRMLWSVQRAT